MRLTLFPLLFGLGLVASAQPVDVLLLGADDASLQPLLAKMERPQLEKHATWSFWSGKLAGRSVVLARTEGDPLNAVAVTTLGCHLHPPHLIVSFGVARAHDPALRAGDIVVSEGFAAFDGVQTWRREQGEGSDAIEWRVLPHLFLTPDGTEKVEKTFPADRTAVRLGLLLHNPKGRVVGGIFGSANQINQEIDRIAWLRSHWGTSCEDGESAHIAGCALALGIPVVGLRVIEGQPDQAAAAACEFLEAGR